MSMSFFFKTRDISFVWNWYKLSGLKHLTDLEQINSFHPLPLFRWTSTKTCWISRWLFQRPTFYKIGGKIFAEIQGHLGALLSLLGTQCDKIFVTQLMEFWEPSIVTFKFLDFDITLTLEDFGSLTELPIRGRLPMIPSAICTGDFLSLLDLHIFRSLRYVDGRKVKLDYLFQRFGGLKGYDEYHPEFECARGAWDIWGQEFSLWLFWELWCSQKGPILSTSTYCRWL